MFVFQCLTIPQEAFKDPAIDHADKFYKGENEEVKPQSQVNTQHLTPNNRHSLVSTIRSYVWSSNVYLFSSTTSNVKKYKMLIMIDIVFFSY